MIGARQAIAVSALLVSVLLLTGAARAPIDLAQEKLPALWKRLYPNSQKLCSPIRARTAAELEPRWRGRFTNIRVSCRPAQGSTGTESQARVSATMVSGLVTMFGVRVVRYEASYAESADHEIYVLAARYRSIAARVGSLMAKACVKEGGGSSYCKIERDAEHGGIFIDTNEVSAVELYPDPKNPNQTIYSYGWAD